MKISYILASRNPSNLFFQAIKQILEFPEHDKEIIICAPKHLLVSTDEELFEKYKIKFVDDDKQNGSVYAFNKAYTYTDGDMITTIIDDMLLPENYLDILEWIESPLMKKKHFKIVNLMWDGGPGLYAYGHDDAVDGENWWNPEGTQPVNIKLCPYAIIPLPSILRSTIEKEFDGYIFNPKFKHHYCDCWLGFFVSKNETYEPFKWRCPTHKKYKMLSHKSSNTLNDSYDSDVLLELTNNFKVGTTPYV